jgi:hypothetical protein
MSLIDNTRKKVFHIRGTFKTSADLPTTAIEGDYGIVLSTKTIWIYANNVWNDSGGTGGGGGGGNLTWGEIEGNILNQLDLKNALSGKANVVSNCVENNILQTNASGQPIDGGKSFSTDGTLVENLDTKIPTQKAVKTYVATEISNAVANLHAEVAHLIGTETITGDKTFSGSVALVGTATTVTQAVNDNSTNIATTAFVRENSVSPALLSGKIYVGNDSNVATDVTVSGDATISNTGVLTIASGAITGDKLADNTIAGAKIAAGTIMNSNLVGAASNTWKGNNTSSFGFVGDNPVGQLTASGPLTVSGNANSLLNNANLSINQAGATSDGFLSSADWNVFSGKQHKIFSTVGGTGNTDFITVSDALSAGASNILIVSDTTETQTTSLSISVNTNIIVASGVIWNLKSIKGNGINAINDNITLSVKTEAGAVIQYSPTMQNCSFFNTNRTNVSFNRDDFNIDLTGAAAGTNIIGEVAKVYSSGMTTITLPTFGSVVYSTTGLNYEKVTESISEKATITIISKDTVPNIYQVILSNKLTIPFYLKEVILNGLFAFYALYPIIKIASGCVGNIVINDPQTSHVISFGGTLLGFSGNGMKADINIILPNTILCNASNIGTLTLEAEGFKGVNIVGNSKIDAPGAQFSNCVFGTTRGISTGSIYENIDVLNLFTSSLTGDDVLNNGTLGYPFATVQKALEYATYNSIIHLRGTFNESILFDSYDNQILRGENIVFDPLTKVNGQVLITNQSERIYLSDLAISYDADAPIVVNSTNGAHGLNNLHLTTTYSKVILIDYTTSQKTNKMFISNTDFRTTSGLIYLDDILEGGTGTLELDNCIEVKIYIGAGWSVISNNTSFYSVQGVNASYITILNQGETLAQLGDVSLNNVSDKDTLVYNSSNQKWENKPSGIMSVMNAVPNPIENNILLTDSSGQAIDSGKSFSTDGRFFENSDSLIPTQKAVRDYALNKFANDFKTSFPEKLSSDFADLILIEDSANSGSKAYLSIGNINVDGGTF